MSRTVVCYLERAGGGSLITRVRIIADGGPGGIDRSWTAPSLPSSAPDSAPAPDSDAPDPGASSRASEAIGHTRAAARWVADSLGTLGVRRMAMLCVDPDGAVCTWLSAPSPDPNVIQATLMQPDHDDGGGAGGGAARLLALGAGSASGYNPGDASVQALATLERPSDGLHRARSNASTDGKRQRFAVLAVPDAPVRVFIDELDARGIEVDQVVSLWHALAMAWDPGSPAAIEDEPAPAGDRIVASVNPAAAIVAVDPRGRLVWSWSQSGQLVAGGTMRLRAVLPVRPPEPAASDDLAEPDTARRIPPASSSIEDTARLEFTPADAGRIVLDWLSWSTQLGHCPERVACIGPAPVAGSDGLTAPDPSLIGRSLGEAWPGASVGVAIHDDPIGATLQRLLTHDIAQTHRRAAELQTATGSDDPRSALVGLSSRPGRIDRRLHTWIAVGVAGIALLTAAIGFKLHRAATLAATDVQAAADARQAAIDSLKESMPQLVASKNFRAELEAEVTRLQNQNTSIKPPRPLLPEMAALVSAIAEQAAIVRFNHDDAEIKIDRFDLNPVTGVVNLRVPDAESGPAILERLNKNPNLFMKWSGSTPGGIGLAPGERRYNLQGLATGDNRAGGGGGGN